MKSLFESTSDPLFLDLPDAEIMYYPQFFDKEQADIIFAALLKDIPWQHDEIRVYGKIHPQPRLTALFGNEGKPYTYSNITMQPHPWNLLLQKLKTEIERVSDTFSQPFYSISIATEKTVTAGMPITKKNWEQIL